MPDDVFQTAKISKLLYLMEKGKVAQYKNMNLDEIELDLNEAVVVDENNAEDEDANSDHIGEFKLFPKFRVTNSDLPSLA